MDSLGSNHSIPSMSVSTGSQSSSVNSMQEVMDENSSEPIMMHDDESTVNSSSSVVPKKVGYMVPFAALGFVNVVKPAQATWHPDVSVVPFYNCNMGLNLALDSSLTVKITKDYAKL